MTTMNGVPCRGVMRRAGSPDRAHVIATTTTIAAIPARATRRAGSPARARVIAMTTTDAAAAGTAAGTAIRRATRKHPVAAGRSEVARAPVLGPTTTMTGGHRARVIA